METSCHCLPASGCGVWPRLSGTPNGMCKPHPTSDFQQRIQSSLDQTVMNRCLSHSAFSVKIYRCLCMWDCVWICETWNLGNIFQDILPCRFHVGKMLHAFAKLEEEMAPHSSILAWRIPRIQEPGRLQSTGSQKVRCDWATEQASAKWHQVQCPEVSGRPLNQVSQPRAASAQSRANCGQQKQRWGSGTEPWMRRTRTNTSFSLRGLSFLSWRMQVMVFYLMTFVEFNWNHVSETVKCDRRIIQQSLKKKNTAVIKKMNFNKRLNYFITERFVKVSTEPEATPQRGGPFWACKKKEGSIPKR